VDFEQETLERALSAAGFRAGAPAFFQWMGVVMYLERTAVVEVLRYAASTPQAEIVFDYTEPFENYPAELREKMQTMAEQVSTLGEQWISFFEPADISGELLALGFSVQEDWTLHDVGARYLKNAPPRSLSRAGGHILRARRA
jgi:O-methyltransferase involved in polyketide biosynthesis